MPDPSKSWRRRDRLLETICYTKRAERLVEVEKILELSPKFAYAHYELAHTYLNDKYEKDQKAYRKAVTPHYEAVAQYARQRGTRS